ncbi:MAG: exodeoxyribonuclease III [Euryarchaeota archaeon]|nr:exodeoxyribonuclease III [Euryarchaeota archaeon]
MRVITWNVNSVRARLERLAGVLERHAPDVLCLQETKVKDEAFPHDAVVQAGYRAVTYGTGPYNGVALLSKEPLEDVMRGFPHDPVAEQPRVVAGRIGDLTVVNVYVVNGKAVGDPAYAIKLEWLELLRDWIAETWSPQDPLLVVEDFNVAPTDADVHDPERWRERNLCSTPERERVSDLLGWGLVDLHRQADPEAAFTWWDHRAGSFHRGWGLRIDLALGTEPVARRVASVTVDREERKKTSGEGNPSDHAPVIVDLADA